MSLDFNTYVHQEPTNKNLLVNYSHSSISLSFDVLDGLFRQCPMYFNYLTARSCTIVLLLWKKINFMKCCIFSERHQILVTRILIFVSSPHCAGKCMAKFYAVYMLGPGKVYGKKSLNCQLISNSVIQIHSFCLVRYYAGLALIVLVLMEGDAHRHILLSA